MTSIQTECSVGVDISKASSKPVSSNKNFPQSSSECESQMTQMSEMGLNLIQKKEETMSKQAIGKSILHRSKNGDACENEKNEQNMTNDGNIQLLSQSNKHTKGGDLDSQKNVCKLKGGHNTRKESYEKRRDEQDFNNKKFFTPQRHVKEDDNVLTGGEIRTFTISPVFHRQRESEEEVRKRRQEDRLKMLSDVLSPKTVNINSYLDMGCGNCEISAEIGSTYKVSRIVGCDVYEESQFMQPKDTPKDVVFEYITNRQDSLQPLDDASIDLITCFMVLHHIKNIDVNLKELQRVIRLKGYLYIREHDVPAKDAQLDSYLRFKHEKFDDCGQFMKFWGKLELRHKLRQFGFQHISDSLYADNRPNRQRVYHSLFQYCGEGNVSPLDANEAMESKSEMNRNDGSSGNGVNYGPRGMRQVTLFDGTDSSSEESDVHRSSQKNQIGIHDKPKESHTLTHFHSAPPDESQVSSFQLKDNPTNSLSLLCQKWDSIPHRQNEELKEMEQIHKVKSSPPLLVWRNQNNQKEQERNENKQLKNEFNQSNQTNKDGIDLGFQNDFEKIRISDLESTNRKEFDRSNKKEFFQKKECFHKGYRDKNGPFKQESENNQLKLKNAFLQQKQFNNYGNPKSFKSKQDYNLELDDEEFSNKSKQSNQRKKEQPKTLFESEKSQKPLPKQATPRPIQLIDIIS